MSRSQYAQPNTLAKLSSTAAVGCMLALAVGCRFSTVPGDALVVDAGPLEGSTQTASRENTTAELEGPTLSTGSSAVGAMDAGSESADAGTGNDDVPDAGGPSAAAGASTPANQAGTRAPTSPVAGSQPPPTAAASTPVMPPDPADDAGTTPAPDAGAAPSPQDVECSAELANCLLRNPLGYAECLRMNQDNGCPDTGVPTTSPVTAEDGRPLSQACQAELANCIMRLPTPENAESCTEKARKCK